MITGESREQEQDDFQYFNNRQKYEPSRIEKIKSSLAVTPDIMPQLNYRNRNHRGDHGACLSNDEAQPSRTSQFKMSLIGQVDGGNLAGAMFCRRCGGRNKCHCADKIRTQNSNADKSNLPFLNKKMPSGRECSDSRQSQASEFTGTMTGPTGATGKDRQATDKSPMTNNFKLSKFLDTQTSIISSQYQKSKGQLAGMGFANGAASSSYTTTPASQVIVKLDQLYKPKLKNNRLIPDSKEQCIDNRMLWQKSQNQPSQVKARRAGENASVNCKPTILQKKQASQSNPPSAVNCNSTVMYQTTPLTQPTADAPTPMSIAAMPTCQHQDKYVNFVKGTISRQSVSPARNLIKKFQANSKDNQKVRKIEVKLLDADIQRIEDEDKTLSQCVSPSAKGQVGESRNHQTQALMQPQINSSQTVKLFDDFISKLPPSLLDTLNINDSQQLNRLQIQYQCFQMEEQLRCLQDEHDQGMPIEHFQNQQQNTTAAFLGDFDKFTTMDSTQRYQFYKTWHVSAQELASSSSTNESLEKKLRQQKLHLAKLSYEYAHKLTQLKDIASKAEDEKDSNSLGKQQKDAKKKFKVLIDKAQQIQKANKMLQGIEIMNISRDSRNGDGKGKLLGAAGAPRNGLPGIPKEGKETSKKGTVGIDYSMIIEEKKNDEKQANKERKSSGMNLNSSDSLTNFDENDQTPPSKVVNDALSFEEFSALPGKDQYKLVGKHYSLKQTLKMIQLPDSRNLNKQIINVSLSQSREDLKETPDEPRADNLMIINAIKKNPGNPRNQNQSKTCTTNMTTFEEARESYQHVKATPPPTQIKIQTSGKDAGGKYKRLKMPSGLQKNQNQNDHYNNNESNMKQYYNTINSDIINEHEYIAMRENFKKLREEIKPSYQKDKDYSRHLLDKDEIQKKSELQAKQRSKNAELRAMIANNKPNTIHVDRDEKERVFKKELRDGPAYHDQMLLTMKPKHQPASQFSTNKQDKANSLGHNGKGMVQRVYHLNGNSVKLSESRPGNKNKKQIEKYSSNNLDNEFETNYTSPKNGVRTETNFSRMPKQFGDDDMYINPKYETERNATKNYTAGRTQNDEDYNDSIFAHQSLGRTSPRSKRGDAKTQNPSVQRRLKMPQSQDDIPPETPESNITPIGGQATAKLERFQDLKSSNTYTPGEHTLPAANAANPAYGKMMNITFKANFKNLADRTMGGGFGGYGSISGGRYMPGPGQHLAHVIGRNISNNGLKTGEPRSWIGQKYNYRDKYQDIDSFLNDFNQQNPKSIEDLHQITQNQDLEPTPEITNVLTQFQTLNVKKMNLNKHQTSRFEENKAQFEAILRETIKMKINQRVKNIKRRRLQEARGSKESKEESPRSATIENGQEVRDNYDYDEEELESEEEEEDEDEEGTQIHLVTVDGPDPNAPPAMDHFRSCRDVTKKGDGEVHEATPIEQKKVIKYFPPRKLVNPFEEAQLQQEKFLQARKDALAKYSEISKNRYKQDETTPLKYVIRPGNNSSLIERVLEESGRTEAKADPRDEDSTLFPGWEPSDDQLDSLFNFKWKPTSCGLKYDMISKHGLKQLVNHVQGHQSLTTKDRLFYNMKAYYEAQKVQSVYDIVPLTIVLDYMNDNVGEQVHLFVQINKIIDKVCQSNLTLSQEVDMINDKIQKYQFSNHKNIKTMLKITECCHKRQNLWLLKPTGFNQGIGIHIFQNFDQLCDVMASSYGIGRGGKDKVSIFQPHKSNMMQQMLNSAKNTDKFQSQTFVIQKLIERPLLFNQRKFDIRVWVLVTSYDTKCYLYKEGYMRTSSKIYKEYDPNRSNSEQIFMQLTNNAIQRHGEEYGKYEEGNILSLTDLFNYVSTLHNFKDFTAEYLQDQFKSSMIQIIQNAVKSVRSKLTQQTYTFELFGFDFLLDELLNTILIEVNTNPCLEESNKFLKALLPRMIDDLLNIVSDPLFNNATPSQPSQFGFLTSQMKETYQTTPLKAKEKYQQPKDTYQSIYPLPGELFGEGHPGYQDHDNLWEHICSWNE